MNIIFISSRDISQKNTLSGTPFYMVSALRRSGHHVTVIDKLIYPAFSFDKYHFFIIFFIVSGICKVLKLFHLLFGKNYQWERTVWMSKYYAWVIQDRLKNLSADLIMGSKASIEFAFLKTSIPIIHYSDTCFSLMVNYYKRFSHLSKASLNMGHLIEQQTLEKAKRIFLCSHWAAKEVVSHYHISKNRVVVIYNGPNLDEQTIEHESKAEAKQIESSCNLLLVGSNWKRKGCDIAVDILKELNERGIPAYLTICGCVVPQSLSLPEQLKVIPSLDKSNQGQYEQLIQLYRDATFFLFPTRAECLGISIIEAFLFGLPVLATRTGGIPEIVEHNKNGFLFDLRATVDEYVGKISDSFTDKLMYQRLSHGAKDTYFTKTNWEKWAEGIEKDIVKIIK